MDIKVPWEPVILISLVLGAAIGAAQGYFVAFSKIPSFIVTLGGMLIFRGLTGNMLLGQFVGPFPKAFQNISSGFIPDFDDFDALQAARRQFGLSLGLDARRHHRRRGADLYRACVAGAVRASQAMETRALRSVHRQECDFRAC